MNNDEYGSVRYIVQDVQAAIDFYTTHLGFTLRTHPASPFADVTRGSLRVLLSGPGSSGARATPAEEDRPGGAVLVGGALPGTLDVLGGHGAGPYQGGASVFARAPARIGSALFASDLGA